MTNLMIKLYFALYEYSYEEAHDLNYVPWLFILNYIETDLGIA